MLEQLKNRRSCRKFDKDRTIEEEKINQVINAGLYASNGWGIKTELLLQ